jgi:3-oxoacyl-[acyl-carrier protein] reductase
MARQLAASGAKLFLTGWSAHDVSQPWGEDPGGGERIRNELRDGGSEVEYVSADFTDPRAAADVFRTAGSAVGAIDILVANHARSASQSLLDLTADELDLCFAVNARATLLLIRHFVEQHTGETGGRVVTFTSGQYHGTMPDELPYIASKAVIQQLTATLAVELAPRHITVNCVNPGPNDTGYATGELHRRVEAAMPMGRWGKPEDAARLVTWLCSDEADWITGQTIASDGGWSARGAS